MRGCAALPCTGSAVEMVRPARWLPLWAAAAAGVAAGPSPAAGRTCEPIRVELCRGRGYNLTTMPNLAGHELQSDADGHLKTFAPLVQYGCSSQLLLFLCAVLVPMCTDKVPQDEPVLAIGPCRGLCEAVRARCYPVLQGFGYPWPPQMDCAKFPPHNGPAHMCMEGPGEDLVPEPPLLLPLPPSEQPSLLQPTAPTRCPELRFSRADKQMAEVWLSIWAGLCFVSSVLALLTLRLGPGAAVHHHLQLHLQLRRRRGGPSPLSSLALSYALLSVGWGVRVLAGRAGAAAAGPALLDGCERADLRHPSCATVFILTYYFGTASILWWVVLTAVWFLSAGLRMSPKTLQRHSYLFHLAGWGVPAALTVGVLVLRDVDADYLTGSCQVGPMWSSVFVLAPQSAFLFMGLTFLALGALTQCRSHAPQQLVDAPLAPLAPLWPLPAERLGLLAGLCSLPTAALVTTHLLELLAPHTASLRLFQARLLASLIIGVAAPIWVWPSERPWPACPPSCPPRIWKYKYPGLGGKLHAEQTQNHQQQQHQQQQQQSRALLPSVQLQQQPQRTQRTLAASSGGGGGGGGGGSSGRKQRSSHSKHRKHHGSETTV